MASILFLDGNHALRSVLAECLRNDGYTVLEAADMAQAERACKAYDTPIDLSIMEAEAGIVTEAKHLAEKYPAMKILYIGGPEWKSRLQRRQKPKSRWLEKPFTYDELAKSVRSFTGGREATAPDRSDRGRTK